MTNRVIQLDNLLANDDVIVDDIGGNGYQYVKLAFGAEGTANIVQSDTVNPLPVTTAAPNPGATELTKAVDAASGSADVGIAMLGVRDDALTTLTPIDGDYSQLRLSSTGALWTTISGTVTVTGTVAVSGTVTVDGSGVTQPVSGTVTANLSATDNAVLDSIDTAVNGTLTVDGSASTQPVSAVSLPLPTGAATSANQGTANGHLATLAGAVTGTEFQVDVLTMPTTTVTGTVSVNALPAGTNNIGDVDVASLPALPAGTNNIGDVDVLTLPALPAGTNNIGDVDVATIAAGSNLIGDVGLGVRTSGGTTAYYNDGTATETQIKGTAGQVYWINAINLSASVLYLQIFDNTSAGVTPGTTAPTMEFPLPTQGDTNGAGFNFAVSNGIEFATGITFFISTGKGTGTAATADEVLLNLGYN